MRTLILLLVPLLAGCTQDDDVVEVSLTVENVSQQTVAVRLYVIHEEDSEIRLLPARLTSTLAPGDTASEATTLVVRDADFEALRLWLSVHDAAGLEHEAKQAIPEACRDADQWAVHGRFDGDAAMEVTC